MLGLQMHHSVFISFVLAYSEILSLWDLQKYHGKGNLWMFRKWWWSPFLTGLCWGPPFHLGSFCSSLSSMNWPSSVEQELLYKGSALSSTYLGALSFFIRRTQHQLFVGISMLTLFFILFVKMVSTKNQPHTIIYCIASSKWGIV